MNTQNGTAARPALLLAAALLGLAAGTAHAGEGARMPPQWNVVGNPFPYAAPQSRTVAAPPAFDTGSQAFPASDGVRTSIVVGQEMPPNNSEGAMQTANSLPPGYAAGAVTYFAGKAPVAQPHQTAGLAGAGRGRF